MHFESNFLVGVLHNRIFADVNLTRLFVCLDSSLLRVSGFRRGDGQGSERLGNACVKRRARYECVERGARQKAAEDPLS